jgi:hypothetical protein
MSVSMAPLGFNPASFNHETQTFTYTYDISPSDIGPNGTLSDEILRNIDMASTVTMPPSIPNTIFTTGYNPADSTIYSQNVLSAHKYYVPPSAREEPAIARNAELIKGIKELQTKMKCMKEGADDFFQKPQAVVIYFEMMLESIFKGKV